MAARGTHKDGGVGSNVSSFSTGSITSTVGRLYLFAIVIARGGSTQPTAPTVDGTAIGVTFTQVTPTGTNTDYDTAGTTRGSTFLFSGLCTSAGTGTVGVTFGYTAQNYCYELDEEPNVNQTTPIVQAVAAKPSGTTPGVTLAAFASVNNGTYAFAGGQTSTLPTAGTGFTILGDDTNTATVSLAIATEDRTDNDTVPDFSAASTTYAVIGVEINTDTSQFVNIGQVTETDTAQPITSYLVGHEVGLATETDTALAMSAQLAGTPIGLATETDTALPITVSLTPTVTPGVPIPLLTGGSQVLPTSGTRWQALGQSRLSFRSTETDAKVRFNTAGSLGHMRVRLSSTGDGTLGTISIRKNGADPSGGPSIALTLTTGEFEDAVGAVTVAAGDDISYQATASTGVVTSTVVSYLETMWSADDGDIHNVIVAGGSTLFAPGTSSTNYNHGACYLFVNSTQANGEWLVKLPAGVSGVTIKNLTARVVGGAAGTATTTVSINGATGAGTAPTVTTSAGGGVQTVSDTSNSIVAVDGDKISVKLVTSSGTSVPQFATISYEVVSDSADGVWQWLSSAGQSGGVSLSINDGFSTWSNPIISSTFNETAMKATIGVATTASLMSVYAVGSGTNGHHQRSRVSGSTGNQDVLINTTGWITDTTHSDTLSASDSYYQFYDGTGVASSAPTLACVVVTFQTPTASSDITPSMFQTQTMSLSVLHSIAITGTNFTETQTVSLAVQRNILLEFNQKQTFVNSTTGYTGPGVPIVENPAAPVTGGTPVLVEHDLLNVGTGTVLEGWVQGSLQWEEQLGQPGVGSIVFPNDVTQPTLGNTITCYINGIPRWTMIVEEKEKVRSHSSGKASEHLTRYGGRGLMAIMARAATYPIGGLQWYPKQRDMTYNWTHPDYDDTWWVAPTIFTHEELTTQWAGYPPVYWTPDFPVPEALGLAGPLDTIYDAALGRRFFRQWVDIPEDREYFLYWGSDDAVKFYIDGTQVIDSDEDLNWTRVNLTQLRITAGRRMFAWECVNLDRSWGANPTACRWTLLQSNTAHPTVTEHVACSTPGIGPFGARGALMVGPSELDPAGFGGEAPGMTPGRAMELWLAAVQARGCLPGVVLAFDGLFDSAGAIWEPAWIANGIHAANTAISTKIMTDGLTFIQEVGATYIEFRFDPTSLTLYGFNKGTMGIDNPVQFMPGDNTVNLTQRKKFQIGNVGIGDYREEYYEVTDGTSIGTYGRMETVLEIGAVHDRQEAVRVLEKALAFYKDPREEIAADVDGPLGYEDYDLGDRVTTLDSDDNEIVERVLAIKVTQSPANGRIQTGPTVRDIFLEEAMMPTLPESEHNPIPSDYTRTYDESDLR